MRTMLYIIVLGLLFLAPVERLDVAKLEPVQTVAIYTDGGEVVLETDTQNMGRGADAKEALHDLEENTPGVIYLETAQYLLVTESATEYAEQLREDLKPSVYVSMWDGKGEISNAARYLSVHGKLTKFRDWKTRKNN